MRTNIVSAGYFDVFGIRASRGRLFDADASYVMGPPSEVILTQRAARALFGDADPIGQLVEQPGRTPLRYTVIGITPDIRSGGLSSEIVPAAYLPFSDGYASLGASVFVKSMRATDDVTRMIAATAAGIDRTAPLYGPESMDALIGSAAAEPRLIGRVLGLVSVIAVVLASVGLYGLVWQSVMERSRELGVRMAIGASRPHIAWLVGRRMLLVLLLGLAAGIGAARLASRVLESQFFGVLPGDPAIITAAALGLAVVTAAAIARPVYRATTLDPVAVLRTE
jgi:ABC-type antimicrobial peptide transport system permease subunit